MGTNILLSLIVGVAMTAIVGSQIGPNYIEQIKIKKVQTKTINNQEIIFEGIKRYVTIKQIEPNSLQDVINAGYLNPNVNDNGFTGGYTIYVPSLPGCISEGDTKAEALENIKEAIDLYLETTEDEMVFYNSQLYDEVLV